MAPEFQLISLSQLQSLYQQQEMSRKQLGAWSLTGRYPVAEEVENAWDVHAFKANAGSVEGSTWTPRSYSCSFCAREFRSAQALGGHMNVHRRDRAQSRHSPPAGSQRVETFSSATSTDFVAAGGGSQLFSPIPSSGAVDTRCCGLPAGITPYRENPNLLNLLPMAEDGVKGEKSGLVGDHDVDDGMMIDEIDLELRLGW